MNPGLLAGACLCALLSSFAAEAGTTKTRPLIGGHGDNVEAFVSQHDDNADGRLTWAEFDAFRRNRFDVTDSNGDGTRSEEHTSELQSLMRISYAVFCLKKKIDNQYKQKNTYTTTTRKNE